MKGLLLLLIHLVAGLARLLGPGGVRGLVAENLLIKQQLLILSRTRQRAPNLSPVERCPGPANVCARRSSHNPRNLLSLLYPPTSDS
jgi:glutamyl-tRNA reductase